MAKPDYCEHCGQFKPARAEGEVCLTAHVYLSNHQFEGKITVPLDAAMAEKEAFIRSWISMMREGLICSRKDVR